MNLKLSHAIDAFRNKLFKQRRCPIRCLLYFLVIQRFFGNSRCHIGYTGNTADFHSHMVGSKGLTARTHTDSICSEYPAHPNLCRRFIIRPRKLEIAPLFQRDHQFCRPIPQNPLKSLVINMAHIRKTRTEFFNILTDQRRWYKIRNLIPNLQ